MKKEIRAIVTLYPLIKDYKTSFFVVFTLGMLASLSEGIGMTLLIPLLQVFQTDQHSFSSPFLQFIDSLTKSIPINNKTLFLLLVISLLVIMKSALSYIYSIFCHSFTIKLKYHFKNLMFRHILSADQSFLEQHSKGSFVNTLKHDTFLLSLSVRHLVWLIINICTLSIYVVLLLLISWQLTIGAILTFAILSLIVHVITKHVEQISDKCSQIDIKVSETIIEGLNGIKTIRCLNLEKYEIDNFLKLSKDACLLEFNRDKIASAIHPVTEGLAITFFICIFAVSIYINLALPVLITFLFMLFRLQPQVQSANYNLVQVRNYSSYVGNLLCLLNGSKKIKITDGGINFIRLSKHVEFANVSFRYQKNKSVLNNLSFVIPKGKTLAIVGVSGSGKSTIVQLIYRFYDPDAGEIFVDNTSLKQMKLNSWRQKLALVSQDTFIFNTSIYENIRYGNFSATDQQIKNAAKQAYADEFIEKLPDNYNTIVGDQGIKLSAGQKQRIAIARAFLSNSEILIFDEATNCLDNISEKFVQKALSELSADKTVIVIAHRLSTIKNADNIIVLSRGCVVEQGNFAYLLQNSTEFNNIYHAQFKNELETNKLLIQ